ncbi:MAG TPA: SDR family NAD(P)-dependent oxidoreductase [Candidatus Binatia bacterium]
MAKRDRVLITGASSGIGEALARRFAAAGHDLVLVARRRAKLKALAAALESKHGIRAAVEVADLAKPGAAAKLAAKLAKRRVVVDILVNNAGINAQGRFHEMPPEENLDIVALNVTAATEVLAAFLPSMTKRGHGRVLNVASASSFVPVPYMATYAASKAYLLSLTESLAEELDGTGVTITALCPGVTDTPMLTYMEKQDPAFTRLISLTVADVHAVAAEGFDACMAGEVIRVPGIVNLLATISARAVPRWVVRRVSGFLGRTTH